MRTIQKRDPRNLYVDPKGRRWLTFLQGPGLPNSPFYQNVHRISDRMNPKVAAAFSDAIQRMQAGINIDRLERALRSGRLSAVQGVVGSAEMQAILLGDPRLLNALRTTATLSGRAAANVLRGVTGMRAQFNAAHPNVIAFARTQTADLVRAVTTAQKESIRIITALGQQAGLTVRDQAKAIRQVVGLPPNWVQAPINFHNELVAGRVNSGRLLWDPMNRRGGDVHESRWARQLERGIAQGKNLDPAWVQAQVDRYTQNLVNRRSLNIARTETMRAANSGQREAWSQAVTQGVLPATARRVWIVTLDDRLREEHAAVPEMNPDGVPIDGGEYDTPLGPSEGPPLEVNCRCSEGLIFPEPGQGGGEEQGPGHIPTDEESIIPDVTGGGEEESIIPDVTGGGAEADIAGSPEDLAPTDGGAEGLPDLRGTGSGLTDALTQAVFNDVAGSPMFAAGGNLANEMAAADMTEMLAQYGVDLTPEQIVRGVVNVPSDWVVKGDVWPTRHSLKLDLRFFDQAGKQLGGIARALDFEAKSVDHDIFELTADLQGKGVAKQVLRSAVQTYERLGMEEVTLLANMDVGGYAWARYGFLPQDRLKYGQWVDGWKNGVLRGRLEDSLVARERKLVEKFGRDAFDQAWMAVRSDDKTALRLLASNPLGKDLLLGQRWEAVLKLGDRESMDYFWNYAGRPVLKAPEVVEPPPLPFRPPDVAEGATRAKFIDASSSWDRLEHAESIFNTDGSLRGTYAHINDALEENGVGLSAEAVVRSLVDIPDDWIAKIGFDTWEGHLQVSARFFTADGEQAGRVRRILDFQNKHAEHMMTSLEAQFQGKGISKRLLQGATDVYERMGFKSISLYAGDMGSYAYARYGFLPGTKSTGQRVWPEMRAELQKALKKEGTALRKAFGREPVKQIEKLLGERDPRAMRLIASNPAGKEFLRTKRWVATLDLQDPESMAFFRAYTTGGASPEIALLPPVLAPPVTYSGTSAAFVQEVKDAWKKLPEEMRFKVEVDEGVTVHLPRISTDAVPELRGVQPRGWRAGSTFENCGAFYRTSERRIILAEYERDFGSTTSEHLHRHVVETFRHEYGHAVDNALGEPSHEDVFWKAYKADVAAIPDYGRSFVSYYLQPGTAGAEEAFAEGFAELMGGCSNQAFGHNFPNSINAIEKILKGRGLLP